MGSRLVLAVTLLASTSTGCKQVFGLDEPMRADASVDVAIDMPSPDARTCFGAGLLSECVPADAPELVVLSSNIDTMTDPRCGSASDDHCVIRAEAIELPAQTTVIATGARPLVLVARDAIHINGTLDVSSRRVSMFLGFVEQVGAGSAGAALCTGALTGTANGAGGGGGAGGSFGGQGGDGGIGDDSNGGAGGTPGPAVTPLLSVRGGCRGTRGGGAGTAMGAGGGAGGGVAYLIAGASIEIKGAIHAGGMGGYGGDVEVGGGGGGSGGLIVLDAPSITNAGVLTANGGGGGEGGGGTNVGSNGASAIDHTQAAGGGANVPGGGNGGAGSFGSTLRGGDGGTADSGGGGGGGGAGLIRTYPSQALSGLVSPPAM